MRILNSAIENEKNKWDVGETHRMCLSITS